MNDSSFIGTQLTQATIQSITAQNINFSQANFSGCQMTLSAFQASDFSQADLSNVSMQQCNFSHATLPASLTINAGECQFDHVDFTDVDASNAQFIKCSFNQALFANTQLAKLTSAIADFAKRNSRIVFLIMLFCDFATFDQAQFADIKAHGVSGANASFHKSQLQNVDFSSGNLSYADLSHAQLEQVYFNNADCTGMVLHAAYEVDTSWSKAKRKHMQTTDLRSSPPKLGTPVTKDRYHGILS